MNKLSYTISSLTIFAVILTLSCAKPPAPTGQSGVIKVMQTSVAIGDPHIVSDSATRLNLIYSIYEALVKLDDQGAYQPSLAESWTVGEDQRTWTFKLRSGVKFHNGETLCADDVVVTLGRVLDPAIGGAFGTQGVYLSYLGDAEISAIDDLQIKIVTKEPMADLLDLLVAMPISPESELNKLPGEYVGSGPYKIAEQNVNQIMMKAHDEYWGKAPLYQEIHWIGEADSARRVDALLNGQADVVSDISVQDKERIMAADGTAVHELKSKLCIIFMCNSQEGPCQDPRVRQALNYALNVDEIITDIKKGAATRLNGYLTPHHYGYNSETPVYPYDPEKARSLLAEAGYNDNLKLVFDLPTTMPNEAIPLAQAMVEQYKQVGITVELVQHPDRAAYSETVREKQINDACCFDSSPRSTYRVLREKIHSELKGPWWQGYHNEEVNSLIGKAETTFDDQERQQIYQQIFTTIRDDAPWIFLYRPTSFWGAGPTMKDWKVRKDGLLIFN